MACFCVSMVSHHALLATVLAHVLAYLRVAQVRDEVEQGRFVVQPFQLAQGLGVVSVSP